MALHICRETFTGELAPGLAKTFRAGVDVLDDTHKDEAALLKKFGAYFSEVASTHLTPQPAETTVPTKATTTKRASKTKAAPKPTPEPVVEPTPEPIPEPTPVGSALTSAQIADEMENS